MTHRLDQQTLGGFARRCNQFSGGALAQHGSAGIESEIALLFLLAVALPAMCGQNGADAILEELLLFSLLGGGGLRRFRRVGFVGSEP